MLGDPLALFWRKRLEQLMEALEKNGFTPYLARDVSHAGDIFMDKILPELGPGTVSFGDSETMFASGVLERMRADDGLEMIETFDMGVSREERHERRRRALLSDLFLAGANAVTETGALVNLDMVGNRVGGITFGPRNVAIFAGRNKVVADIDEAMHRIKNIAAPANAVRHQIKTPCAKTSRCMDCKSPGRICNVWSVVEKSFPKGRIRVVLINQDLGL